VHWLSYDRLLALGALVLALGLTWLGYAWTNNGSVISGSIISIIGVVIFVIGFLKPKDKAASPSDQSKRIGYSISDNAASNTRNARIRNQDIAFRVRDNGRLTDENSDIG